MVIQMVGMLNISWLYLDDRNIILFVITNIRLFGFYCIVILKRLYLKVISVLVLKFYRIKAFRTIFFSWLIFCYSLNIQSWIGKKIVYLDFWWAHLINLKIFISYVFNNNIPIKHYSVCSCWEIIFLGTFDLDCAGS